MPPNGRSMATQLAPRPLIPIRKLRILLTITTPEFKHLLRFNRNLLPLQVPPPTKPPEQPGKSALALILARLEPFPISGLKLSPRSPQTVIPQQLRQLLLRRGTTRIFCQPRRTFLPRPLSRPLDHRLTRVPSTIQPTRL